MFEVGDIIRCINSCNLINGVPQLKAGELYTVSGVREWANGIGVTLHEIKQVRTVVDSRGKFYCRTTPPYNAKRFEKFEVSIESVVNLTEESYVTR